MSGIATPPNKRGRSPSPTPQYYKTNNPPYPPTQSKFAFSIDVQPWLLHKIAFFETYKSIFDIFGNLIFFYRTEKTRTFLTGEFRTRHNAND